MRRIKISERQFKSLSSLVKESLKENLERYVRHKENTAEEDDENWIVYWQEQTGLEIPGVCPSCGDEMCDPVGGHVTDDTTGEVFITPVCRSCNSTFKNSRTDENYFHVKEKFLVKIQ